MCHATQHGLDRFFPCLRHEARTAMKVPRTFYVRTVAFDINPAQSNSHDGFVSVSGIFPPPSPFTWGWVRKLIWYLS